MFTAKRSPITKFGAIVAKEPKFPEDLHRFLLTFGFLILFVTAFPAPPLLGGEPQGLQNGGFEASKPRDSWEVEASAASTYSITSDKSKAKEGSQSVLISATDAAEVALHQELFLPVGTLWRLTGWVSVSPFSNSAGCSPTPQIGIETPVGDQGFSPTSDTAAEWRIETVLFRVPSPGRIVVTLSALKKQAGKVWFDDIRLEPVKEPLEKESITISSMRLRKRPIDLKQGGQFIEPLCDLLPSMIAQQVDSTSFEDEPLWNQAYKREIDKPYRPWYPDGSVHAAKYSFDSANPFNGKRSQRIDLPLANTSAGISQDGFYLEAGHSYCLRLHSRSNGAVQLRASLHAEGEIVAGPASLGTSGTSWRSQELVLTAKRKVQNATLTIEFEGPGVLWLDRIYLIETDAVLGLWRSDVVSALKQLTPGVVRFGGSTIETFDGEQTIGNWDTRAPFSDDPWGGLQENFVGREEFVQLTQYLGADPLLCLRWTGKTPMDAAHEVEYFNGGPDTEWGRKRAANGHPAPYHIKYWQIGNEVGAPEYDASVKAFASAMRGVDPTIKILSSFPSEDTLAMSGGELDYLCPHHYSIGDLNGTEDDFKRLQSQIARNAHGRDVRVAATEWNATGGEFGLGRGMLLTLGNALATSRYQNMLHRHSDLVEIANRSNLSDSFGSGVIQPGPGWLYLTPTYFSQQLYQRAAGSFPLEVNRGVSPSYLQEPDLDATLSEDGKTLRVYAVNSTPDSRTLRFRLDPQLECILKGTIFVLEDTQSPADSEAMNSRNEPARVALRANEAQFRGDAFEYTFGPFSVSLLEMNLGSRERSAEAPR